jgi:putative DNA primase/helicase
MIDGPTPLHLIEKPTPGTGATLMVDAIATILTGAGASVMTEGRDDEEWRKRITAKLRQIPSLVLIDNLRNELDSSALAAALTAPFWEDRILGVSEMARLPIRCTWIATGNNPSFSNEMSRRLVRIRLDARVDQPWRRDGFRHPDLMGWVRSSRGKLVAACLTLCQAWIAAGRPRGQRSIGSYENWAQAIGGVLETVGIEGFLSNLDEMLQASDAEGAAWRGFIETWWDRFGTAEVSTSDLLGYAMMADPALPIGGKKDQGMSVSLGRALGKMRDRAFRLGDRFVRVTALGVKQQAQRWRLTLSQEKGTEQTSPSSREAAVGGRIGRIAGGSFGNPPGENSHVGQHVREVGEVGEDYSNPNACAGMRVCVAEAEKTSPTSPTSPSYSEHAAFGREDAREDRAASSRTSPPPSWLDGVP